MKRGPETSVDGPSIVDGIVQNKSQLKNHRFATVVKKPFKKGSGTIFDYFQTRGTDPHVKAADSEQLKKRNLQIFE